MTCSSGEACSWCTISPLASSVAVLGAYCDFVSAASSYMAFGRSTYLRHPFQVSQRIAEGENRSVGGRQASFNLRRGCTAQ
ncbi:hypothetical protein OH76DRAFT_1028784 [Lentinus brumalis]|uniref:Uncharacterized protein n=1 Tax=Lentinus brumalis TaxID=2498619 RepID=A0A371CXP2_9APHY|nr:hypothetical protein OH76DRAFT_1028784 [Polyporus brumalis]